MELFYKICAVLFVVFAALLIIKGDIQAATFMMICVVALKQKGSGV